jgi:hypothetical protein
MVEKKNKKKKIKKESKTNSNKKYLELFAPWLITILITITIAFLLFSSGNLIGSSGLRNKFFMFQFFNERLLVTTITSLILIFLMNNYISIYIKTKANFSLGLTIVSISLFLHSLSSNPAIMLFLGFKQPMGFFGLISLLFTFIASVALLLLSRK